jgi:pyrimidine deaminase RibD-like protein/predicted aspartyl protease
MRDNQRPVIAHIRLYCGQKSLEAEALVDTGATGLTLPRHFAHEMEVSMAGQVRLESAAGPLDAMYGAVEIEMMGRRCPTFAFFCDVDVILVGINVLHRLGLTVDPTTSEIYPTPLKGISYRQLEVALELARRCTPEDNRRHPSVGAVIVKGGKIVSEAHRNEDGKGGHAEQIAIDRCEEEDLTESIIITTLEPCTKRAHRSNRSCAEMIVYCGMRGVVIGMPDPNPVIRGSGDMLLRLNNVEVSYFPSELSGMIWELNQDYVKEYTRGKRPFFLP